MVFSSYNGDMILQTYISNNEKIVHIKPKPSTKGKGVNIFTPIHESEAKKIRKISTIPLKPSDGGSCQECGKILLEKRYRFCSIACKVTTTHHTLI